MNDSAKIRYVKRTRDRLGRVRCYYNRPGYPRAPLPGEPGSDEFMAAYRAAAGYEPPAPKDGPPAPISRVVAEGTFNELVVRYYASPGYQALSPITKAGYRNEIERLRAEHGQKPLAALDRKGVKLLMARKAAKPGAANKMLRTLRMLMQFAVDEELRLDDPTARVKRLKVPGDGFRAWGEEDIAKFEARWPVGSKPRLALALLLYSAQRRGDVIRLGRSNIHGRRLCLTQSKTGTYLEIPIHPALLEAIRLAPVGPATFLVTELGKPFTPAGFGNWFSDRCRAAGLPKGYNAHGLRKAAARRLAEAGCTTLEIMAFTGHKSIAEIERYTRAASRKFMADGAMEKLNLNISPLSTPLKSGGF